MYRLTSSCIVPCKPQNRRYSLLIQAPLKSMVCVCESLTAILSLECAKSESSMPCLAGVRILVQKVSTISCTYQHNLNISYAFLANQSQHQALITDTSSPLLFETLKSSRECSQTNVICLVSWFYVNQTCPCYIFLCHIH